MKAIAIIFISVLLAGVISSCKHDPVSTGGPDTTKHDTGSHDTTSHDTTDHTVDTTSHNFQWTEYSLPLETNITGDWVFGPHDIWCNANYLYHFDGASWNRVIFKTSTIEAGGSGYSLFSPDSTLWLTHGSVIFHCYPATQKADQFRSANFGGGSFTACWGASSKDMFFVGTYGTIAHYDGTSWQQYPKVTMENLQSVWGTSHSDVWATGYNLQTQATVLMHYDGGSWTVDPLSFVPTSESGGFGSVWACDSAGAHKAYAAGTLLYRKTNSSPWLLDSVNHLSRLGDGSYMGFSIVGNSFNDIFGAGPAGFFLHWNGRSWYRYDQFFAPSAIGFFTEGLSMKGNTVCVVGMKDSQSWIEIGQRQ